LFIGSGTLYELEVLRADIKALMRNLTTLAQGETLPLNLLSLEDRASIRRDPYGLVLVLGAWNYPFSLTLQPVAGAIAAGNVVIIKPSECAPKSAALMAALIPRYLDTVSIPKCIAFIIHEISSLRITLIWTITGMLCYTRSGFTRNH